LDKEGNLVFILPIYLFLSSKLSCWLLHSEKITVHLDAVTKFKNMYQANAKGISMSALMSELVEERLDLYRLDLCRW